MFVIIVKYIKPLTEVDRFLGEHSEFMKPYYASGSFLMSGRQEPRCGGVIICKANSRLEIETIVQNDPFNREKIAEYDIIEFLPSMVAPQLANFKNK